MSIDDIEPDPKGAGELGDFKGVLGQHAHEGHRPVRTVPLAAFSDEVRSAALAAEHLLSGTGLRAVGVLDCLGSFAATARQHGRNYDFFGAPLGT